MLTTRMHERYQMAVLPFALVLYAYTGRGRWLGIFGALSGITFVNQFMLLIRNNTINDPAGPLERLVQPGAGGVFGAQPGGVRLQPV